MHPALLSTIKKKVQKIFLEERFGCGHVTDAQFLVRMEPIGLENCPLTVQDEVMAGWAIG